MAKRAKQNRLPGTENCIRELDDIGLELKDVEDERKELTDREVELRQRGIQAMHKHHIDRYVYDNLTLFIEPGQETLHVRVKRPKKEKTDES
jgi:hypothetical protein